MTPGSVRRGPQSALTVPPPRAPICVGTSVSGLWVQWTAATLLLFCASHGKVFLAQFNPHIYWSISYCVLGL